MRQPRVSKEVQEERDREAMAVMATPQPVAGSSSSSSQGTNPPPPLPTRPSVKKRNVVSQHSSATEESTGNSGEHLTHAEALRIVRNSRMLSSSPPIEQAPEPPSPPIAQAPDPPSVESRPGLFDDDASASNDSDRVPPEVLMQIRRSFEERNSLDNGQPNSEPILLPKPNIPSEDSWSSLDNSLSSLSQSPGDDARNGGVQNEVEETEENLYTSFPGEIPILNQDNCDRESISSVDGIQNESSREELTEGLFGDDDVSLCSTSQDESLDSTSQQQEDLTKSFMNDLEKSINKNLDCFQAEVSRSKTCDTGESSQLTSEQESDVRSSPILSSLPTIEQAPEPSPMAEAPEPPPDQSKPGLFDEKPTSKPKPIPRPRKALGDKIKHNESAQCSETNSEIPKSQDMTTCVKDNQEEFVGNSEDKNQADHDSNISCQMESLTSVLAQQTSNHSSSNEESSDCDSDISDGELASGLKLDNPKPSKDENENVYSDSPGASNPPTDAATLRTPPLPPRLESLPSRMSVSSYAALNDPVRNSSHDKESSNLPSNAASVESRVSLPTLPTEPPPVPRRRSIRFDPNLSSDCNIPPIPRRHSSLKRSDSVEYRPPLPSRNNFVNKRPLSTHLSESSGASKGEKHEKVSKAKSQYRNSSSVHGRSMMRSSDSGKCLLYNFLKF